MVKLSKSKQKQIIRRYVTELISNMSFIQRLKFLFTRNRNKRLNLLFEVELRHQVSKGELIK